MYVKNKGFLAHPFQKTSEWVAIVKYLIHTCIVMFKLKWGPSVSLKMQIYVSMQVIFFVIFFQVHISYIFLNWKATDKKVP